MTTHVRVSQPDHLFDAELRYQEGMPPVARPRGDMTLVGSGTGEVYGPRIRGMLRWSNFEQVLGDHCRLNVVGTIETDDGAEIRFDSQGFAVPAEPGLPSWHVAAAARFTVQDSRYSWMQALTATWQGEFDPSSATARYRAYIWRSGEEVFASR